MIDDKELEKNIPLVKYIIAKTFSGAMTEDMIQAGCEGLVRARLTYDERKGKFSTYATFWIKKYLVEESRTTPVVHPTFGQYNTHKIRVPEILRFDVLEKNDSVQWAAEDVETPADLAVRKVIRERIRDCIDRLPALQAYVVRHVFGIGCEMQSDRKIGSRLGVSGQYINQVRHKALETLSADPQIKEYWEST